MQAESEILTMISVGIVAMAFLVIAVVIFVAMYHQRGIRNRLELEQIKLRQSEELIINITHAQELERKRISAHLHDEVGAALSAVNLLIGRVRMTSNGQEKELAEKASEQINQITIEVRNIVQNMSPSIVERFGLIDSIVEICNRISSSGQVKAEFISKINSINFVDKEDELMIYRIVQELTNNVIKHSQASEMNIFCAIRNHELAIKVADNGKGIDMNNIYSKKSLGLVNIKNRIEILGGKFNIINNESGGCIAEFSLPAENRILTN